MAFREVARFGSFSEAAGTLNVSQSAVSQQVTGLERQVGLRLIDRAPGRVGLTEPGRLLLARVENALAQLSAADLELDSYRDFPPTALRLGAFAAAMWRLVPEAVLAFRAARPALTVEVHRLESSRAVSALKAGELDLALVIETPGVLADVADGTLETSPLLEDRVVVALPVDHRFAEGPALSADDLSGETWLTGARSDVVMVGSPPTATPPWRARLGDDRGSAAGFTAARLGLTLLPELGAEPVPAGVVVRDLVPQPAPWPVVVVGLATARASDASSAMRVALIEAASAHLGRVGRPRSDPL